MLTFRSDRIVAIGEAMVEMAEIGENTYRRSFAGDTFNTAWHLSQLLGPLHPVGFVTKVGRDTISQTFIDELGADGFDASCIGRDENLTMGLYLIELDGAERHFHYWRSQSAARLLADDEKWLESALDGAGLIHVSGITLAILSTEARTRLWDALADARAAGSRISFDPNVRPRLWSSEDETRATLSTFHELTDIVLPSFDDEKALWGDTSLDATCERYRAAGICEGVIKNGADRTIVWSYESQIEVDTPAVAGIRDTAGAGDAFNAGYLAARLKGKGPVDAVAMGQSMSSAVIRHFGARIPVKHVPKLN